MSKQIRKIDEFEAGQGGLLALNKNVHGSTVENAIGKNNSATRSTRRTITNIVPAGLAKCLGLSVLRRGHSGKVLEPRGMEREYVYCRMGTRQAVTLSPCSRGGNAIGSVNSPRRNTTPCFQPFMADVVNLPDNFRCFGTH